MKSRGSSTGKPANAGQPFLALRYSREPEKETEGPVQPFTELPENIAPEEAMPPSAVRRVVNFGLLFSLGIALLALVLAFGYQMIYQPQILQLWAVQMIASAQELLQAAAGTVR